MVWKTVILIHRSSESLTCRGLTMWHWGEPLWEKQHHHRLHQEKKRHFKQDIVVSLDLPQRRFCAWAHNNLRTSKRSRSSGSGDPGWGGKKYEGQWANHTKGTHGWIWTGTNRGHYPLLPRAHPKICPVWWCWCWRGSSTLYLNSQHWCFFCLLVCALPKKLETSFKLKH